MVLTCPTTVISAVIFLYLINSSNSAFDCKTNKIPNCVCGHTPNEYILDCPNYEDTKVRVSLSTSSSKEYETESYEIDCFANKLMMEYIPKIDTEIEIKLFSMKTCKLSENQTLINLMQHLGVKSTKQLRIIYGAFTDLSRSTMSNLENIEDLSISSNDIRNIPDDLFYDMVNLKTVAIPNNKITIPKQLFKKSVGLNTLDISSNYLPQNPGSMFENLTQLSVRLNMLSMNITDIKSDLFKNLHNLKGLDLSYNLLETIPTDVFEHLHSLLQLYFRGNRLHTLPKGLFTNNSMLWDLNMDYNAYLSSLPAYLLSNLEYLQSVSFFNCNISVIPENLLWGTINLKKINLKSNNLRELPAKLFNDTIKLTVINLANNHLSVIPDRMFSGLTELTDLDLSDNIIHLTKDTLFGLRNLQNLQIRNNGLKHLHTGTFLNNMELRKLDLSNNELSFSTQYMMFPDMWSELGVLKNLEDLNLAHNKIEYIFADWRLTLFNLRYLDLSYNNVTKIEFEDFNFVQNNIDVNLEFNNIIDIDMKFAEFYYSPTKDLKVYDDSYRINKREQWRNRKIRLGNNPLHCGCNIYHLTRYFDLAMAPEVHAELELQGNITCATPEELKGFEVKRFKSKELTCDIQDGNDLKMLNVCPKYITCLKRPYNNTLIVYAQNMGLKEAPIINNHPIKNMEVMLSGNNLVSMPDIGMGYEKVTIMDVSNNNINNIQWIPPNVQSLFLHNNNLTQLSYKTLNMLNTSKVMNVTFYNNPWTCDCKTVNFSKYLQENFKKVHSLSNIKCYETGQELIKLTVDELCSLELDVLIAISVTFAGLCLLVMILLVLYYRHREEIKVWLYAHQMCLWFVTEEELDKDKLYDAFISYSHRDEDFVVSKLLPNLEEGANPYKLCLHFRNWQPGEFITANIARSVAESRRTLVILSPNFLASEWGKMEFRTAHIQALSEGRARVIVVLLGDIGKIDDLDDELKAYLSTNTYVKWGDRWFWDKLRYAMPHPPKYLSQQNNNLSTLQKINIHDDKMDLIIEPITPTLMTTPPIDKMQYDPLLKTGALNVSLVNGTLINNALLNGLIDTKIVMNDR